MNKHKLRLSHRRRVLIWREAAAYLRVSEPTLRVWVRDGRLSPCRIGPRRVVFLLDELDRFLSDSMTQKAA
jgi:excisionase family DNA binding protein